MFDEGPMKSGRFFLPIFLLFPANFGGSKYSFQTKKTVNSVIFIGSIFLVANSVILSVFPGSLKSPGPVRPTLVGLIQTGTLRERLSRKHCWGL